MLPRRKSSSVTCATLVMVVTLWTLSTNARDVQEDIDKAKKIFDYIGEGVKTIVEEIDRRDSLQYLNGLSKYLAMLGPVSMAISSGLSAFNIAVAIAKGEKFSQLESAEMKLMRDEFEKMESRLQSIADGVEDLKVIVEKSSARSAYTQAIHTIENLYQDWIEIQTFIQNAPDLSNEKVREKLNKKINKFRQIFNAHYNHATKNIWQAFTIPEVAAMLKFDLLYLYKRDSNCNAMRIREVCIGVTQLLNKGMLVEGAYFGYDNDTDYVEELKQIWVERMDKFSGRCDSFVNECAEYWQRYAERDISRVVYEDYRLPREELAQKIHKRLQEFAKNRSFFVIVHDHIAKSDSDKSSSYIPDSTAHIYLKNVQNMDVHIFSKPLADPPAMSHISNQLSRLVMEQTCFPMDFTKTVCNVLLEKIQPQNKYFALYVVRGSTNPQIMGTMNHFTLKSFDAGCLNKPYNFYVYG